MKWILSLDARGAAPRPSTIREMADILLATHGESPPPKVGVNWVSTFVKRRDELKSRYSRRYDYQRAQNQDPQLIRAWFNSVKRVIEENGILAVRKRLYNNVLVREDNRELCRSGGG